MQLPKNHILIATNTASQSAQIAPFLESKGLHVRCVYTARDAISMIAQAGCDILFLDLDLPDSDAVQVVQHLSRTDFKGAVIVAAPNRPDPRLHIIREQAFLIAHPVSVSQLYSTISTLLSGFQNREATRANEETLSFPEGIAGHDFSHSTPLAKMPANSDTPETPRLERVLDFGGFIGTSPVMLSIYEHIQSAARSSATVFITGESGTGKEVCAQAIHKHSERNAGPFIPLNCAAIPRDLLESELFGHVRGAFTGAISDRGGAARMADGGTLFLDEIGDMDLHMQTKLLRFLQDGTFQAVGGSQLERVNVRIICATNRDPMADVKSGRMREDLFYRLHVLPIVMPPLRIRGEDVLDIAQTLLLRFSMEERKRFKGFSNDAEALLTRYNWPGNIRQLQNIVRHIVVMNDAPVVSADMLPVYILQGQDVAAITPRPAPMSLGDLDGSKVRKPVVEPHVTPLHILERQAIERAIMICSGNIPRAAAMLQVSLSTIYRKKLQWENGDIAPESAEAMESAENAGNSVSSQHS